MLFPLYAIYRLIKAIELWLCNAQRYLWLESRDFSYDNGLSVRVSCCYLFGSKARNIYSSIDYISILHSSCFYVSLFCVLCDVKRTSQRCIYVYILLSWENELSVVCWMGFTDLPQYVFHRFFSVVRLSFRHWIVLCDEWDEEEGKLFIKASICESHVARFVSKSLKLRFTFVIRHFFYYFNALLYHMTWSWHF